MPCYFLARLTIHDPAAYARYLEGTDAPLARHGAQVLAVDESPQVLEGDWPCSRTVLIAFPDEAAARAWYDSPEYQAIAQHRRRAATTDAVFLRGRP
jgi:uncharacterized protein (DUF1330 family)